MAIVLKGDTWNCVNRNATQTTESCNIVKRCDVELSMFWYFYELMTQINSVQNTLRFWNSENVTESPSSYK